MLRTRMYVRACGRACVHTCVRVDARVRLITHAVRCMHPLSGDGIRRSILSVLLDGPSNATDLKCGMSALRCTYYQAAEHEVSATVVPCFTNVVTVLLNP